jgi:uncharacterized membrane protein YhhN
MLLHIIRIGLCLIYLAITTYSIYKSSEKNFKDNYLEKALPGIFLILASLFLVPTFNFFVIFLILGLVACLVADVLIVKNFIGGLIAFALAHILFIVAMFCNVFFNIHYISTVVILIISSVLGIFIFYFGIKSGKLIKELKIPVVVYIVIISTMLIYSFSQFFNSSIDLSIKTWAIIGAVLFYISDAVLAYIMFIQKEDSKPASFINLLTYYVSLFFMFLPVTFYSVISSV